MTIQIPSALTGYKTLIGLDWAHGEHCYVLCHHDTGSGSGSGSGPPPFEQGRIANTPTALRDWFKKLGGQDPDSQPSVALCVEDNRTLLMSELASCPWIDVYAVNPVTAAGYRKMFAPSGDKSDERDASMLLDLLLNHHAKLRVMSPRSTSDAKVLDELCRARRKAVDKRTSRIESLVELLRRHYPLAMEIVGAELSKPLALAFLKRWKNTTELLKSKEQTLRAFFYAHRCRSTKRIEERLAAVKSAPAPSEKADPFEAVFELQLAEFIDAIASANKAIAAYDAAIRKQCREDDRSVLFETLPGAGEAMAPRLLAAFLLVDPSNSVQMQLESGIAPIRIQSGGALRTSMRCHCAKFLRQTFHEYAGCSILYSSWAKAFYQYATKVRKMKPQAAKRELAFKWIRILTACWKSGENYDEERYLERLRKKKVAYLCFIETPV